MRRLAVAVLAMLSVTCAGAKRYELYVPELFAKLDNGMRIIFLPDPTTDLVEVDVRYEVGSNEDPPGKEGLAHLVEHLMFQQHTAGEDKPPIWAAIRQLTIFNNAYTTNDSTHYMMLAKKDNFEQLVALEATRLYTGCQTIPEGSFEREREVVRNEMRFRIGTAEGELQTLLLKDIYPENHPYSREVGGDDASISSITLADACKFMQDYYVPERATMIIAGNVTQEYATQITSKWLTEIPARKPAPRRTVPPVDLSHKQIVHELDVEEPSVIVAWKLPRMYTDDFAAARFMIGGIAGYMDYFGELYEFSTGVAPGILGGPLAPVLVVQVFLRSTSKIDEALEFVWKGARRAHRGIEESPGYVDENYGFEGMRRRLMGNVAIQIESLTARTGMFGDYVQFDPEKKYFAGELDRIKNINGDHVRDLVKASLKKEDAVVVIVKPKAGGKGKYRRAAVRFTGGGAEEKFEVDPAEALESVAVPNKTSLTSARDFKLGNGMRVILMPTHSSVPVVTVNLVYNTGSVHEPASSAGLASVAAGGLFIRDANPLGMVGAQVRTFTGEDTTSFMVRGLNVYMDVLIHGLERLIIAGDYNQDRLESSQTFFSLAMKRKSVRSRLTFQRKLGEAIYGPKHPYATTGIPTPSTYENIGRDKAWAFKEKHYSAANGTIIVTGNFDDKEAEKVIREHFGDMSHGHVDKPVDELPAPRTGPVYIGVEGEESASVAARIAYPGAVGIDKNYAARLILTEMMSERASALREKLGSSYGTRAGYDTRLGTGMYVISGPVDAERAGESLKVLRDSIADLHKGGGTFQEEFVRARRQVLEELLTNATDSRTLAFQLANIAMHHLGLDHYDKLIRQVANMTPEEVMLLVAAELKPELEVVEILGPREAIEKAFREAGIMAGVQIVE